MKSPCHQKQHHHQVLKSTEKLFSSMLTWLLLIQAVAAYYFTQVVKDSIPIVAKPLDPELLFSSLRHIVHKLFFFMFTETLARYVQVVTQS